MLGNLLECALEIETPCFLRGLGGKFTAMPMGKGKVWECPGVHTGSIFGPMACLCWVEGRCVERACNVHVGMPLYTGQAIISLAMILKQTNGGKKSFEKKKINIILQYIQLQHNLRTVRSKA